MSITVVLASAAVVAAVPLFLFSTLAGRAATHRISSNLSAGLAVPGDLRQIVLSRPARERAVAPVLQALARHGRRLTPAGLMEATARRLRLAGDPWSAETFLAVKVALAVLATGAGVVWAVASPSLGHLVLVPAALGVGLFGPDSVVAAKAEERQKQIRRALPDTLDQLTICVEAGLGFDSALLRVATTGSGPLGDEIHRVLQDIQLGIPREESLHRLLDRTDVAELRQFVHAVSQAESYGVPIASALRAQAVEQRERRSSRAEERAQKMPVKIVFPLVLCILPSLFVVVLGPSFIRIARVFG